MPEFGEVPESNTEMWISKRIIENMCGTISEIDRSDNGKEWRIILPMEKATAQALDEKAKGGSAYFPAGCVLYVEDNEANRKAVKTALESAGMKVFSCKNGREGFEAYKEYYKSKACKCIITDLRMPTMSGWEFIRAVRNYEKSQKLKQTPIIVLTGVSSESEKVNSFEDVEKLQILHKPVSLSSLLEAVQIATNHKESRKELPSGLVKKIMIMDDDEIASRVAADFLRRFGYATVTQAEIKEAVDYYKSNYKEVAMILQDSMLGNERGVECIRQIREFENKIGIAPVLVISVSGMPIEYQKEEYEGLGVADFLVKPVMIHDLENVISRFLSQS